MLKVKGTELEINALKDVLKFARKQSKGCIVYADCDSCPFFISGKTCNDDGKEDFNIKFKLKK